jgi:hypothetical protein
MIGEGHDETLAPGTHDEHSADSHLHSTDQFGFRNTTGEWQPLFVGVVQPDGSQTVTATLTPPSDGPGAAGQATEVIVCNIGEASWRISSAWQVEARLGPISCSTPVYHQDEFKTVKRVCVVVCWWSDQASKSIRKPGTGFALSVTLWNPKLSITSAGTYHIHLRDLATSQSGSSALIIDADGADFVCVSGTGCHY